jgi:transcriptional antiterminator NusG
VEQILIPVQEVPKIKGGKRKTVARQLYPSYVLVNMELNEQTAHLLAQTPGIMSFLGSKQKQKPQELAAEDVKRILAQIEGEGERAVVEIPYHKGDSVKIVDGPFSTFTGIIEEVSPERGKVRVMVTIFGRATPVELDFLQVKKM